MDDEIEVDIRSVSKCILLWIILGLIFTVVLFVVHLFTPPWQDFCKNLYYLIIKTWPQYAPKG